MEAVTGAVVGALINAATNALTQQRPISDRSDTRRHSSYTPRSSHPCTPHPRSNPSPPNWGSRPSQPSHHHKGHRQTYSCRDAPHPYEGRGTASSWDSTNWDDTRAPLPSNCNNGAHGFSAGANIQQRGSGYSASAKVEWGSPAAGQGGQGANFSAFVDFGSGSGAKTWNKAIKSGANRARRSGHHSADRF